MVGRANSGRQTHGRRLSAAFAVVAITAGLVVFAPALPRAYAAFQGQPWQTNFEIEPFGSANTVVNGPTPPAGGAGVDWDNAAQHLQDFANPTEPCTGSDPNIITG